MAENPSNRSLLWGGIRSTLPLITSVAPFGMLFGALGMAAGMPGNMTAGMSLVVFAGSSQLIATQLITGGAGATVLLLTTLVVNLRHVLYGLSLAPHMRGLSRGWKWLLAYFMTDETFAVAITRYNLKEDAPPPNLHWFYLGSGLTLWLSWQASTLVGILIGSRIPASWGLDFTVAVTFIALIVPTLVDRAAVAAALVGGLAAVLLAGLPLKLGLVAAALLGILAGMAVDLGWFRKLKARTADD
jgi:4-azaleucine resistance transporter AzlC